MKYDFESISYIPHKWDETLSHWQNGIGHGDDLKVLISDAENTTDAKSAKKRECTKKELDSLFDNIEEIEI